MDTSVVSRRRFIRLLGGGVVVAASAGTLTGCSSALPTRALEAWAGPSSTETDPRRVALAYAITAPNPHNLQPWLVDLKTPNVIVVHTDPTRVLPETDPFGRQILIGHGAFLELLCIALSQRGFGANVSMWPRGELVGQAKDWRSQAKLPIATIQLTPSAAKRDPLFDFILKRHTPKTDFDVSKPISGATLASLLSEPTSTMVSLGGTIDEPRLQALRELCWQSAKVELTTPRTMMESVKLMRVGPAEILQHRDGISLNEPMVRALSTLGVFDRSAPPPVGSTAEKKGFARFEGHSKTSMGFVWLTGANTRAAQIETGRAYVRLQLAATRAGVGVHPMSQALQEFSEMQQHFEAAHRLVLQRAAPQRAEEPTVQMLCRIGYPMVAAKPSPRRPLAQFVTEG
jgi:hypothetical protein